MYKLLLMGATFALGLGVGKFISKKKDNQEEQKIEQEQ